MIRTTILILNKSVKATIRNSRPKRFKFWVSKVLDHDHIDN